MDTQIDVALGKMVPPALNMASFSGICVKILGGVICESLAQQCLQSHYTSDGRSEFRTPTPPKSSVDLDTSDEHQMKSPIPS